MAREMKDSGIMWIGKIPSNWNITRVKYICESYGRIGFRGYTENDLVDEGEGAITISPSNMKNMKMDYSKCSYLSWNKYEESPEIKLSNNDVLFVKTGSTYGKTAIVENLPMEATINPQLLIFKNIKIYTKYFFYNFQTPYIKSQIENAVVGGTIPTIAQGKINNFFFIIPPVPEQRIIADFLDGKCAEIDGLLADLDAEVKTLAEYKKSIIAETVIRGLNPNAPMKSSGIPWAETIPAHWRIEKGKYLFKLRRTKGNPHNLELMSPTQKFGVIPQSQLEGVVLVKEKTDLNAFRTICPGDFCISLRSFQGGFEYSKYEGVVSPAYQVFYPIKPIIDGFFKYMFKSDGFISYINTFSMSLRDGKNIAFEDFGNSYIPIPPIEEQVAISNYLDEKCTIIEQSIADKQNQIETLKSYKASLIYEYVTGKKQVI